MSALSVVRSVALRRGQQIERRQLDSRRRAARRHARAARLARARGAGASSSSSSSSTPSVVALGIAEARLEPVGAAPRPASARGTTRGARGVARATAAAPAAPSGSAAQCASQPSETERALLVFILGVGVVARSSFVVGIRVAASRKPAATAIAASATTPTDRDGHRGDAGRAAPARTMPGSAQHGVADDAAEPGRQRPGAAARQARGEAAASNVAGEPEQTRIRSRSSGRCVSSRQPQIATGSTQHDRGEAEQLHQQVGADRARACRADCAPARLVAWLSDGSCTDQVASATAPSSASVISATPPSSRKRRRNMSRKCRPTKLERSSPLSIGCRASSVASL